MFPGIQSVKIQTGGMKMNKKGTKLDKIKCKIDECKEKTKEKVKEVDKFIKEKPYRTLGITAGAAALLGAIAGWFLTRKREK